jgi:hypothetical protein
MEGMSGLLPLARMMRSSAKEPGDAPAVDKMTALQVRQVAALATTDLLERLANAGPRQAAWRTRRSPMRAMPMKEEVGGVKETWKLAYLFDVILTRDPWMHRVDVSRATGREMVLTPDHDGRIVADVVAEWARRHGRPFTLHLEGPAGGSYTSGDDAAAGEAIDIDAVEFCRILSGRGAGEGLLAQEVPF